jgi:membrane-bound serine protease (ClpP class)
VNRRRGVAIALVPVWAGVLIVTMALAGRAQTAAPIVLQLRLNGVVDPFMASYVERGIATANDDGDAAVLLVIDTPGGLDSSMRHIVEAILGSKVPVICYTAPSGARAASAGTFIMLACPINAMAPGTNIGAAHPVGVSGVIENEKVTNDAAAFIRSLADRWGRNADWAEKAVRDAISASADDALAMHVVDYIASSTRAVVDDVPMCSRLAGSPPTPRCPQQSLAGDRIVPFGMSLSEGLFHSLADPNIAFLLINIGFLAMIAWIFHPGFHVALGVGIVSMVLGLAILETLPVRLTGVILLFVAAVLFVLDVKAKAHGVLTTAGTAMLVLGGLLLFNPTVPNARVSRPLLVIVAVGAGLFAFFVLRAMLSAKDHPVRTGLEVLRGSTGMATTALDPKGLVRARGETWTAEAVSGSIPAGTPVRIVDVKGVKLLVESEPAMDDRPVGATPGGSKEGDTQ